MSRNGPKMHLPGRHPKGHYAPGYTRCGTYAPHLTLDEDKVTCAACRVFVDKVTCAACRVFVSLK